MIDAHSKTEIAHVWIRDRISSGRFVPGYRLVISQLAKEIGVSIGPVREAIRLLEAEGLVTFERNIGAQVALRDETAYHNVMESIAVLEGAATALGASYLSVEDIERARHINVQMRESYKNLEPHRFTELNREFHAMLYSRCPNKEILRILSLQWDFMERLRMSTFSFVPERAEFSVVEHEELLQLIELDALPADIEEKVRSHRYATIDALESRTRSLS